jgi:hypothetical protein
VGYERIGPAVPHINRLVDELVCLGDLIGYGVDDVFAGRAPCNASWGGQRPLTLPTGLEAPESLSSDRSTRRIPEVGDLLR